LYTLRIIVKFFCTDFQLTNLLSSYIMQNRDRFFDPRNIKVVMCGEDPLGVAFELKAFHRTQVT
jgi:hypothetical protein